MKIGFIYKNESYQSLNNLNTDIISLLKKEYDTFFYQLENKSDSQKQISNLYNNVDFVLNTSSKLVNYQRNKPTIFLGHAWMDHGAGVNLYHCNSFLSSDMLMFASSSALEKYRYIYKDGLPSLLLPYFTSILRPILTEEEHIQIKKQYNIPIGKKILVYFGRLCSEKNIDKVVDFYQSLDREDTCLLLIGGYSEFYTYGFWKIESTITYKQKIEEKIKNKKNIILVDGVYRDKLRRLLSICSLAINLSHCYEEDFWLSTIEAMRLGLPVIWSAWWWLKDTIEHEKTWFLIKTTINGFKDIWLDYKEAIPFIQNLLDNKDEHKRISDNAIKRSENLYNDKAFSKNLAIAIDNISLYTDGERKHHKLLPEPWIKKIFDKELKEHNIQNIYKNNHQLFNTLYQFYSSS